LTGSSVAGFLFSHSGRSNVLSVEKERFLVLFFRFCPRPTRRRNSTQHFGGASTHIFDQGEIWNMGCLVWKFVFAKSAFLSLFLGWFTTVHMEAEYESAHFRCLCDGREVQKIGQPCEMVCQYEEVVRVFKNTCTNYNSQKQISISFILLSSPNSSLDVKLGSVLLHHFGLVDAVFIAFGTMRWLRAHETSCPPMLT
jgi:hypothetical protein